ncbi:MAG: hypothetical protein QGG55_04840, partial [Verrucomicrobiota bacterium]|nr:hypothetical protein [Verrucomicrobiota bacterium]
MKHCISPPLTPALAWVWSVAMKATFIVLLAFSVNNAIAAVAWQAKDLNPVAFKAAPKHTPVMLV